jgi:Ca-activated chloride channel family protein
MVPSVALAAALWQATPQRPPAFRSSVETVAVYATVRGSQGQFASDLRQDDFEIYDNGQRRDIVAFSNELQPTTVSILLDRSGSMTNQMAQVTAAARAFVGKLLPGDRASLSSLSWDCQSLTADTSKLEAALDRGMLLDLGSPIWRAMDRVMSSLDAAGGRRAVLVFSDGQDTGFRSMVPTANVTMTPDSCRAADQLADVAPAQIIAHARQEGVLVYAVSVQGAPYPGPSPGDDSDLKRIAKDSGGEAYVLKLDTDLTGAFTAIADELHHQYLLGFVPAVFDNKVHTIDVRVKRTGLTVRARKSYVASRVERSGPEADARAFAARPPWPEVATDEVQEAIRNGEAGRRLQASCTAADVFPSRVETRASVRVVAEGPIGRIMRAAGEARRRQQAFAASAVNDDMRAPVVAVTATLELAPDAKPSPLTQLQLRGRGPNPIAIVPTGIRPAAPALPTGASGGLSATFAMTDFKGLPGGDVEVVLSSAAGHRSCRFSRDDVAAIR